MPHRRTDPQEVQAWVATLSGAQRLQYVPTVRRLLSWRSTSGLGQITTAELVDFVTRTTTSSTGPKAVSALKHFFAAITAAGIIPMDPARFLSQAVKQAKVAAALRIEFAKAGLSGEALRRLSWRDIVPLTLGRSKKDQDVVLSDGMRNDLTDALLARLRATTGADVDAVLDAPLLEHVGG